MTLELHRYYVNVSKGDDHFCRVEIGHPLEEEALVAAAIVQGVFKHIGYDCTLHTHTTAESSGRQIPIPG